ncbi:unnamed protein product [Ceutorhynchus assimilis]|uniref:Uncharacterized protein n=1 Tax=Ceutorhynchus assimilis TaxID=467358 RepID=A0A9P0DK00_9CUCU|nr:unnamed protein product [Ceutorhynchus assimilis]
MEGVTAKETEKELTSTSTSSLVVGKLLSTTNKEEKNDSNDTVPTSSTDASTSSKSTHLVSDDIISSTSSEAESSKTKNMDAVDNAAATFEAELLGMSMKRSTEKIEENVDDLVNDLETLLGEPSDTFVLTRKTVESKKEKTEVSSHDDLVNILEEKLDNEVSSNTETAQIAASIAANIGEPSCNKLQDSVTKIDNQSSDIDKEDVKINETTSSQGDVTLDSRKENLIESVADDSPKSGQSLENKPAADLEVIAEKCNISIEVDDKQTLLSQKLYQEQTNIGETETESEGIDPTVEFPEKKEEETEFIVEDTSGIDQESTEATESAFEENISKDVLQGTEIAEIKEKDEVTNKGADTSKQIVKDVSEDQLPIENIVSAQESTSEKTLIEDKIVPIQISEASNEENIKSDIDQCIKITEQIEPKQSSENKTQEPICTKLAASEEKCSISNIDNTELREEAPKEANIEATPLSQVLSEEISDAPITTIIEEIPSAIIENVVEEVPETLAEVREEKEPDTTSEVEVKPIQDNVVIVQELEMAPIVEKCEEVTQENMPVKESEATQEDVVEPKVVQEDVIVVTKSETTQEHIPLENVSIVEKSDISQEDVPVAEKSDLTQGESETIIPLVEEPEEDVPLVEESTKKVEPVVEESENTQENVPVASKESELECVVEEITEEYVPLVRDSDMTEEYVLVVEEPEEQVSVVQNPETSQEGVVEESKTAQEVIPVIIEEITETNVSEAQISVEDVPVVEESVSVVEDPEIAQEDLIIVKELKNAQENITLVEEHVPVVEDSRMPDKDVPVVVEPEKLSQKIVFDVEETETAQEDVPVIKQADENSLDNVPVVEKVKIDQEGSGVTKSKAFPEDVPVAIGSEMVQKDIPEVEKSQIAQADTPVDEKPEVTVQEDDPVVNTAHKEVSEVEKPEEKTQENRSVIDEQVMPREDVPELEKSQTAVSVAENLKGITQENVDVEETINVPIVEQIEAIQEQVLSVEAEPTIVQENIPVIQLSKESPGTIEKNIPVVAESEIIQNHPEMKEEFVKLQKNVPIITEMEESQDIEEVPASKQKDTVEEKGEASEVIQEKQPLIAEYTKTCEVEPTIRSLAGDRDKTVKDNKLTEPIEQTKLVSEVNIRRKTVEQDLEKVVCLSEESSDSDISSLPKPSEDLSQYTEGIPQYNEESTLISIAEEVDQFVDSPLNENIVSFTKENISAASNFETAMAVASLQNETISESHVERRLSEKEIREMEAIRMAVASITDSSQDNSYDSYLVDNTMTAEEFVSEDIENTKSAEDIETCLAESTSVEEKEICKEESEATSNDIQEQIGGVIEACLEDASEVDISEAVASDSTQVDLVENENRKIDFDKKLMASDSEALVTCVEAEQQHEQAASVATLEQVEDAPVEQVEQVKETPVEQVIEIPMTKGLVEKIEKAPVEQINEAPVEQVKDALVEQVKETPVEQVQETPVEHFEESIVKKVAEASVGQVNETPLEQEEAAVKQVGGAPVEQVKDAPVEQVEEASVEPVEETSVEIVQEGPIEQVAKAPVEKAKEAPIKQVAKAPVEQAKEAPVEQAKVAPIEQVAKAPVEQAKESSVEQAKIAPTEQVAKAPVEQVEKASVEQVEKVIVEQVAEERPKRTKRNKVIEPLSINVEEVDKKEKIYSPKVTIKPIKAPDEEVSTTSADADANKVSLKMTITKQSDKMHSILKVFDPEDEIEVSQTQEEPIRKSVFKPKIQQVEKQHSPKMSTRSTKVYSPTSTRSSSPRINKPVTEIKPDPHSPLKFTLKSVMKPEEVAKKLSVKPTKEQEPKNHSPKIKIKPIPMPVEEEKEEVPKLNIKAIKRHLEEDITDVEQGRSSPKVVKPQIESPTKSKKMKQVPSLLEKDQLLSVETVEDEAVEEVKERIVLKINKGPVLEKPQLPSIETVEDEAAEEVKERIVLKINKGDLPTPASENDQLLSVKTVEGEEEEGVKERIVLKINKGDLPPPASGNDQLLSVKTVGAEAEEESKERIVLKINKGDLPTPALQIDQSLSVENEVEEEVKERIVLKINKGNLPSPVKDSKKRNCAEEEKLEKAAIKMKFSTTGGTTHIVQDSEETSSKRQRTDSGYSAPSKFVEEVSQKRPLEEKVLEKNKRLKNSVDDKNEDSNDAVRIVETKLNSPIVISEDSRSQHSADCVISDDPVPDISKIANIASATTHIAVTPVLTVGVATPVTPSPKKRGRPRKAVLEVRKEFSPVEASPTTSSTSLVSSDAATPEASPSPGGRPKRSCRGTGQNVTAILGLKPRKPRGGGRGRGGKVNMGDRQPPAAAQAAPEPPAPAPPVVELPVETVPAKAEKEPKTKGKQKLTAKSAQEEPSQGAEDSAGQAVVCVEDETEGEGGTSPKKKKDDKTSAKKLEVTSKKQKSHQKEEAEKAPKPVESPTKTVAEAVITISTDDDSNEKKDSEDVNSKKSASAAKPKNSPPKKTPEKAEEKIVVEENKFKADLLKYKQIEVVDEEEDEIVEEEDEDSGEESDSVKRKEWVLQRKREAIKKCRAKRMEKLAKAAELKRKRLEQAQQQREARKAAEEAAAAAGEKERANKRYGRYGKPKPQISLIDAPVEETAGTIKSNLRLFHPGSENIDDDDTGSLKQLESPQKSSAPEPMLIDSEVRRSLGAEDIVMLDEETRMSADFRGSSRSQTPAKQAIAPPDIMVEDSQGSMGTEGGKSRSSKAPKMEVFQDLESLTAEQLAEYSWNSQGPFMIQEQVAQYLGIKSFKRKYPNITRRQVDMQERDYLKDCNLVTETQCDLGLTAVIAQDILDIMYTDFQDKFEDYCKCQRERQARELINKQKALNQFVLKPGFDKLDILEQAVQSAAAWNKQFNKARREQRRAHMDLQTLTVHYPKSRMKPAQTRKIGHYPVALVPGQFTDYYQDYTPTELNNLPINTMCYDEIKIGNYESYSDGSSSGSESDSDSTSGSSSDSAVCDEDYCGCVKKVKIDNNDSDDVVIIENDASSSDSCVLVSVTAGHA